MPVWELDQRALKVLTQEIDHRVSYSYNKDANHPPSAEEISYARSVGYWCEDEQVSHDDLIRRLHALAKKIKPAEVAESFVAGIGQKRADYRSPIASYILARSIPSHAPKLRVNFPCLICEVWLADAPPHLATIDRRSLLRDRLTIGGSPFPCYALADLEWHLAAPRVRAGDADWKAFDELLDALRQAPEKCAPNALSKLIGKRLGTNDLQRQRTLEILAAIGVLEPKSHPSFWRKFTPYEDRARIENKNDWEFPMRLWRGHDGVNEEAVAYWFVR